MKSNDLVRTATDAAREARVRRLFARDGYALRKSRARNYSLDNQGGYRIVNLHTGFVDAGVRYDLTLEDVEAWAADED